MQSVPSNGAFSEKYRIIRLFLAVWISIVATSVESSIGYYVKPLKEKVVQIGLVN
jgi:hypothetical protein